MTAPLLDLLDIETVDALLGNRIAGPHLALIGLTRHEHDRTRVADADTTWHQIQGFILCIDHRNLVDRDRQRVDWARLRALLEPVATSREIFEPADAIPPPFIVVTAEGDAATRIEYYQSRDGAIVLEDEFRATALLGRDLPPSFPALALAQEAPAP